MYYNHGYEGFIEFDIEPALRDELIIRTAEIIDRKNGNEFYFEGNKLKFLYPNGRYDSEPPNQEGAISRFKSKISQTRDSLLEKPALREKIYDLLLWITENGSIVHAEITPYDKETGEKFEQFLTINNRFYRSVSIEREEQKVSIPDKQPKKIKFFQK